MSPAAENTKLLPLSFHDSFKPERPYLHAVMKFVAGGGQGTIQEISEATGIPTGQRTGKVNPTIRYCTGMGLLTPVPGRHAAGVKVLELTEFGKKVLQEDKLLNYPVTQWLAHFNMCNPRTGAGAWVQLFVDGAALGRSFTLEVLTDHLRLRYPKAKKPVGPLVGIYSEPASLAVCGALKVASGLIMRTTPPLNDEMYAGYGAWLLQLIEDFFPGKTQVTLTDLQAATKWRNITGWSDDEEAGLLAELEQRNLVDIDRHMTPWIISVKTSATQAWQAIYDELL